MEEIDDMNPRYVDFLTENMLAPHVIFKTEGLAWSTIHRYLERIKKWSEENCEADWHVDFYIEGCLVNGARTKLSRDCIIAFFELKSDLVAFKMVWGDDVLVL